MFDRATSRMSNIQNKLATTQAQLAVGKQILSPSTAPDQAAAIQRLKGEIQRQDSHIRTLDVAMRRYTAEETALSSSNDLLIRMKELGIQAANDTLGPDDRKAIGVEMKALRDQLLSLATPATTAEIICSLAQGSIPQRLPKIAEGMWSIKVTKPKPAFQQALSVRFNSPVLAQMYSAVCCEAMAKVWSFSTRWIR